MILFWLHKDADAILEKTFESRRYDEMVIVKHIDLESHCEHHMVPIIGVMLLIQTIEWLG